MGTEIFMIIHFFRVVLLRLTASTGEGSPPEDEVRCEGAGMGKVKGIRGMEEHLLRTILGCLLPLVACQLTRLFNAFLRFCSKVGFRLLSVGVRIVGIRGVPGGFGWQGGKRI